MVCIAVLLFFLALGNELKFSNGAEVSVYDVDNKLCLYANLMVSFSVTYDVAENKKQTVSFELPEEVSTEESTCGDSFTTLKLSFAKGHSWTVSFTKQNATYQAPLLIFTYNLGDAATFPNALTNDDVTVFVKPFILDVNMGSYYSCKNQNVLKGDAVTQTLWNVDIQAFVVDGKLSENVTSCAADTLSTLPPVTTATTLPPVTTATTLPPVTTATTETPGTNATTLPPATNVTTLPPATNVTTLPPATNVTTLPPATNVTTTAPVPTTTAPVPTTTPVPTLPVPTTGKYSISPDVNSTSCLMASFGLRIGFKQGGKEQEINLDPSVTTATGVCGEDSSDLVLTSDKVIVVFSFLNETQRFYLHALNVTVKPSTGVVFTEANDSLSLWQAALGSSYMCNKQQAYDITDSLTLYTFELRVQPFAVKKGEFSTAHECSMDDTSILIPIVVGAALAGLILIVLIAYVIGRRKTYVGYQTL